MPSPLSLSNLIHSTQAVAKPPELPKTQPSAFDKALEHKTQNVLTNIVHSIEAGSVKVDALLKSSMTNKNMSNSELLAMQAGMYKYTQELDLCSKVVDKAVNGLRDVLKTQV